MINGDRLAGKVAIVTGGARGMGAAHARAIVRNGGRVLIGDVLDRDGSAVADELGAESAVYRHLDVTSAEDWSAAVQAVGEAFGALNVLVNNAGITNFGPLGEYTRAQWDAVLAVDLTGPYLGMVAAVDALKASAPSSIINVSSASGFQGQAALHGYTASKWGLRGLTKSAAIELAPYNVRVNSVHPGAVLTPMSEGFDITPALGPLGRPAKPEELSNLIVYLASDESSFSTGSEFIADGGALAGPGTRPIAA